MSDFHAEPIRFLFAYIAWSENAKQWHERLADEWRTNGYHIDTICLSTSYEDFRFPFHTLDTMWRLKHPKVVRLYRRLSRACEQANVLINYNGANIHPSWLSTFDTFNVYICWDDPESSHFLSEPTARFFDYAFTGNLACVPLYRSWGVKRVSHLPHGLHLAEHDSSLARSAILYSKRDLDAIFLGERESSWRQNRLDRLRNAFPEAIMRGRGWSEGFLPYSEKLPSYRRAKIGWNIHNSVGPVNLRTFALPANGVLQLCDNKCRLGELFQLDEEVVGFDTIDECIELTHFYLKNDDERRAIARRGYDRVMKDYTQPAIWKRLLESIEPFYFEKKNCRISTPIYKKRSPYVSRIKKGITTVLDGTIKSTSLLRQQNPQFTCTRRAVAPYTENCELGAVNWNPKQQRLNKGQSFEWPNIIALNWAVSSLVGEAKSIVELGSGTGCFAYEASADPKRRVTASELDRNALEWARQHRSRPNIQYTTRLPTHHDGPFDLVVAIEVIEHVQDYCSFISQCCGLASRAIFTTPNKKRSLVHDSDGPPNYSQHVREWTAGEFYWILRVFYDEVYLYSMPDVHVPFLCPIRTTDPATPLVANCRNPTGILRTDGQ